MEIGSFIELQFEKGREYFKGDKNIARLNSGRAAIYHAFRVLNCDSIWLPYYQCDTVRNFLGRKNVKINYYHIDKEFNPTDLDQKENEAVLFVNYYGIMSNNRMKELANNRNNVIIDNSQAFFSEPIEDCLNVYSARKFVGVPDGAYVLGKDAEKYIDNYEQGFSSDTSKFLLERIEYGCEGKTYTSRMENEHRIDTEDINKMSKLTRTILDGTNYEFIKGNRKENFEFACSLFDKVNQIKPQIYYDETCVPMVYPLLIEDENLLDTLLKNKHFQGHWWSYLLDEVSRDTFEYYISKYIIPITIDQRYGQYEIKKIWELI